MSNQEAATAPNGGCDSSSHGVSVFIKFGSCSMIDRLLEKHLKPVARDYWRWQLWRGLARCWATMAVVGFGLMLLHRFTGWGAGWVFSLFNLGAGGWAVAVWRG